MKLQIVNLGEHAVKVVQPGAQPESTKDTVIQPGHTRAIEGEVLGFSEVPVK